MDGESSVQILVPGRTHQVCEVIGQVNVDQWRKLVVPNQKHRK